MALDLIIPRRHATDNEKEESLAQFVRRRLGNEALERMAQPMVGGIYTADPEMLSLSATMPRFLAMEREHGSIIRGMFAKAKTVSQTETTGTSGARYSLFLSFDRGMQLMTDTLADLIGPSTIKLNTRIRSITRRPPSTTWLLSTEHGETIDADAVIIALPAHASAALLRDSAPRLASELDAIPYASTATINIAFHRRDVPHPLDGFGFVVPMVEKKRIIACSFSSVKFAGRAPGDDVLLRVFAGGALQPEIFALHDKELIAAALSDLRDLLGVSAAPIFSHVERWPRSMAQYHVGHLARIKKIDELVNRTQGLRLAGNAYQGAGIPDCIRSGERAAETVYEEITAMSKLHAH
jgi:oxygen-dependent protoporphyrinogen oxidase